MQQPNSALSVTKMAQATRRLLPLFIALVGCSSQAEEEKGITLTLSQQLPTATFTYTQYNAELAEQPCAKVSLTGDDGSSQQKALCQFTDRFGRAFDLRQDVSFSEFSAAQLKGSTLHFSVDVSLRDADAFILDCVLPFTATTLGESQCSLRDLTP